MSNTVSVITVNYNAGDFLGACASSALSQVDEVVVVDNASSDDSLAKLATAFPGDRRLKIIRNRENLGFAAACNIGAEHSISSCLFFLNPDCMLTSDTVKHLMRVLDDNPDVGMVGGLLMNPDGSEQVGAAGYSNALAVSCASIWVVSFGSSMATLVSRFSLT